MIMAEGSDIHLEFGPFDIRNKQNADVLILAGDICVARDFLREYESTRRRADMYLAFFEQASSEFEHVLYIMGNHEHYNGVFGDTYQVLKSNLQHIENLMVMNRETFWLDDVCFSGCTLWTDMDKESPRTMLYAKDGMNDYIKVSGKRYENGYGFRTLTPAETIEEHKKDLEFIQDQYNNIQQTERMVVIGHHLPSFLSIHEKFKNMKDSELNGAYASELHDFIWDRPNIKHWIHGHAHIPVEYMINKTHVFSNPRGYIGRESWAADFKLKYVEV